jgi:hypothetical protein
MSRARLNDLLRLTSDKAAAGGLPVVVFDLDSTLFSTRPRNLRILREYVAERRPDLVPVVAGLVADDFGWEVRKPLLDRGVGDEALYADLDRFWFERFFTDAYVVSDEPMPGAAAYATRLWEAGAFVYYLTGRHVGGMEIGTATSLTRHGFPFWRGRVSLHLKPDFRTPDKAHKDEALAEIRSLRGEVVACFENEPANANLFQRAFPDALHFLLQTEHSPDPETPHPDLIRVPDFRLDE